MLASDNDLNRLVVKQLANPAAWAARVEWLYHHVPLIEAVYPQRDEVHYRYVPGRILEADEVIAFVEATIPRWRPAPDDPLATQRFYGLRARQRKANQIFPPAEAKLVSNWHGDLSLENIIVTKHGRPEEPYYIDWRTDYGGRIDVGDIYYEVGKLRKSLRFDHSKLPDIQPRSDWWRTIDADLVALFQRHFGLSVELMDLALRQVVEFM